MTQESTQIKSVSTWSEVLAMMPADFASGAWRTMSGYTVAGRSVTYRTFADWQKAYEFVKLEAAKETGTVTRARTTACMPGTRGRR